MQGCPRGARGGNDGVSDSHNVNDGDTTNDVGIGDSDERDECGTVKHIEAARILGIWEITIRGTLIVTMAF